MSSVARLPVYAHRGASARALENTWQAFEKALALGADGIELDVQLSKEGIPVIYHDLQLKRLTGKHKAINECTVKELQKYKLGKSWRRLFSKYTMPTFHDVVVWANERQMPLNIELKSTLLDNHDALYAMLEGLVLPKGSHFSSFHYELLEMVKWKTDYETALIATKKLHWDLLSDYEAIDTVHMHKKYYKTRYLEACVASKKACRFYAVDGSEIFLTNPHPAVKGWITDYPDYVLSQQIKNE
ncbi:glycerophosphodiester phosphodiesterase [Lysinibacillus piscis]|uniref:Glycerophosphoryl diester phosphodiesterase n=1 Tax=Lysinibacillus piscis TaxID=2518931 RepID=A0ABQ5NKE8_9BACI|nr:glycerophosphodiester phosphodiesterase [Lysinibacillus sp. KH24]GLC88778.1 glycerophosphoryl diester phosphodiesterase [Lysinibacillus sp. KH24]